MNITTSAQEAIANLIDLAEKGEIDPWDVPVITIIDRFLAELGLLEATNIPQQEPDLPRSGQAFLWASMLVLLKADTLHLLEEAIPEETDCEDFIDDELLLENIERRALPADLERHLRRRTSVKPLTTRRVTLQELIEQLEHIAAEIEAATSNTRPQKSTRSRSAAIKAIAQLAHNENLTELAAQLEHFLYCDIPQLVPENNSIDWERFLQLWHQCETKSPTELEHPQGDRAGVFWALLLLSAQSKVELSQEEFYQDLWIHPLLIEDRATA
jgi:segregation and condensation protein A